MFPIARVAFVIIGVAAAGVDPAFGSGLHSGTGGGLRNAAWRRGLEMAIEVEAIPLFARQTNRMCSACHVNAHYIELTEMGRTFKLNAYRLTKVDSAQGEIEENTAGGRRELLLNRIPLLGFMLQTSYTATQKAQPGSENGTALLPEQLSLFLGGRISPKTGGFLQITYSQPDGSFGVDNIDFRFADSARVFSKGALVGLSLNNNPTVQDLWNTTPAWSFPWASSSVAPTPAATVLIDGNLAQQVIGVTASTMWNKRIYGEVGVYSSAIAGQKVPLDSAASGTIKGVAPYWRVAFPWSRGKNYSMVGAYGMSAKIYGVTGATNRFTDVAFDFMDQVKLGTRVFALHGTWIHEKQTWDPGEAANVSNTLDTYRMDVQWHPGHRVALMLSPFATSGSSDSVLYVPEALSGSRTGSPNSDGLIGEVDLNPWDNVRVQFQYVAYGKFNGSSQDYDGSGRNAAHNNTLYVVAWLMF
jgi:hypothetical protein